MLAIDLAPISISNVLSVTIQWTLIVLAVYYGIHTIFMSTLSADLTVNEPDKWIENFDDLLNDSTYQNVTPTVLTQMNMVNALLKPEKYSPERKLLDKANESNSILTFDPNMDSIFNPILEMFPEAVNGKRALIEDSFMIDILVNQIICHMMPDKAINFAKSKEPVYNSLCAALISYSTEPIIVKLFRYRSQNGVEFRIVEGSMIQKMGPAVNHLGIKNSIQGFQCADVIQGLIYRDIEIPEWKPIPLFFFQRFLYILSSVIFCSFIVLMLEIIHNYSNKSLRRIHRKVRPVSSNVITISRPAVVTSQTAPRVASAPVVRKRNESLVKTKWQSINSILNCKLILVMKILK